MLTPDIASLDELKPDGQTWTNHRIEIRRRILSEDVSRFLTWSVIQATMFVGNAPYIAVERPVVAQAFPDKPVDSWDTNTIHQAYHLTQWLAAGNSLDNLENVVELGGGYGELARLFREMGYKGRYQIYDFPELQALQRYYLETHGISDIEFPATLPTEKKADLFIALWSLSEIALPERISLMSALASRHWLISYSEVWDEVDNNVYFADWPGTRQPIVHLPGNVYLIK